MLLKYQTYLFKGGHSRSVRAKRNITLSFVIKLVSIGLNLVLVPMTIGFISPGQYGIWLTLSSFVGWFSVMDIGFGNGLRNRFAESMANGRPDEARAYVSTTYAILAALSLMMFFVFLALQPHLSWSRMLNAPAAQEQVLSRLAFFVAMFFCLQFALQPVNTMVVANQQSGKAAMFTLVGGIFSVLSVYIMTRMRTGGLMAIGIVLSAAPVLSLIVASAWFYRKEYRQFLPSLAFVRKSYVRGLTGVGLKFFIIQIAAVIFFQTDSFVIAHVFGPEEVTTFNVAYKLFSVVIMGFSLVVAPLWSAFTEAHTKGDMAWIRNVMGRLRRLWGLASLLVLAMVAVSPLIFRLWLGEAVSVPMGLSIMMGVYMVVYMWQTMHVYLLNGIGRIQLQVYLVLVCGTLNIPLSIFLGRIIGVSGVALSNTLLFLFMGWLFSVQVKKMFTGDAKGIWAK